MARSTEFELLQAAHRAAQARIALAIAYLSQVEWQAVSAASPAATSSAWIERSVRAIIVGRQRSMMLAKSYYQLARALDTNSVLGNPDLPEGTPITLPNLREHFLGQLRINAQLGFGETGEGGPDAEWVERLLSEGLEPSNARHAQFLRSDISDVIDKLSASMDSDDPLLKVDRFNWPADRDPEYISSHVTPQLRRQVIDALEAKNKARKERALSRTRDASVSAEDHRKSGSNGAGIIDHFVVNSGRSVLQYAMRRDTKVKMTARCTSGNPCSWCAMLASRGFVYASNSSAGFNSGGASDWHPNCHCYPLVRWRSLGDEALPELSRYFKEQWPIITRGYSGAAAQRVWRHWISQRATNLLIDSKEEPA